MKYTKINALGKGDLETATADYKRYSMLSLMLSGIPALLIFITYWFCYMVSGGGGTDNDMGAVWWIFLALVLVLVPVSIITNILSVRNGLKAIKLKRGLYSWSGISIVLIEVLFLCSLFGITYVNDLHENAKDNLEINQFKEEILSYETFADLSKFGLGTYKLKEEGDQFLWDISKPDNGYGKLNGVRLVFDYAKNEKEEINFDEYFNPEYSNDINNMEKIEYEIFFYENTYIIVTPEYEKSSISKYMHRIYLCKKIEKHNDLFCLSFVEKETVDMLHKLPSEKITRSSLIEKLGKN